jgi:hypothetical protein
VGAPLAGLLADLLAGWRPAAALRLHQLARPRCAVLLSSDPACQPVPLLRQAPGPRPPAAGRW